MWRWILSLLALLGYTGMTVQAQQISSTNQSHLSLAGTVETQGLAAISDGSSNP